MSSKDQSPPLPSPVREQKGYQPRPTTAPTHTPNPQGGHQPTGHNAPAAPPANPPNQGSGGKK